MKNILGHEIPEDILKIAEKHNCLSGIKYVYLKDNYGDFPYASIDCEKVTKFRSNNYIKCMIRIDDNYVAFRSPTKKKHVKGKMVNGECIICGEQRYIERAHFPKPDRKGGSTTIELCPTHHRLLDTARINDEEINNIMKKLNPKKIENVKDYISWAYYEGYPYTYEEIKKRRLRFIEKGNK